MHPAEGLPVDGKAMGQVNLAVEREVNE